MIIIVYAQDTVTTGEKYDRGDRGGKGRLWPSHIIPCKDFPLPPPSSMVGNSKNAGRVSLTGLTWGCRVVAVQMRGLFVEHLGTWP